MSNRSVSTGVKVAKGILYLALCALCAVIVVLILVLGYNTAVQTTNVYMIAKDAFARRAQAVLLPTGGFSDREALEKLFTPNAIANDDVLNSTYYSIYKISNYYERADVDFKIIWPWETQTDIYVTETVLDIKATLAEVNEAADAGAVTPEEAPEISWANGKYRVSMEKNVQTQNWRVDGMELIEHIFTDEIDGAAQTQEATQSFGIFETQDPVNTVIPGNIPNDGT